MKHGVPMDDEDHSECPIELLACPEHATEEVEQTGDPIRFTDKEGRRTVGFCLWCNRDFYCMEEVYEHNHGKSYPEMQEALRAARDA